MNATINYYVFDKIELDGECRWGYKNGNFCEVFTLSADDTEADLIKNGFAKCDAPGTETFCVEESNIKQNEDGSWELV
jgi:hypothetical protein